MFYQSILIPNTDMQKTTYDVSANSSKMIEADLLQEARTPQMMDFFEEQLKNIFWTEKALVKAIPKLIALSASDELILTLMDHIQHSHEQITLLAKVFRKIKVRPSAVIYEDMQQLLADAPEKMKNYGKGSKCDAEIIAVVGKIEQHKIAVYKTLRKNADTLGLSEAVALIVKIQFAEKQTARELEHVADHVAAFTRS